MIAQILRKVQESIPGLNRHRAMVALCKTLPCYYPFKTVEQLTRKELQDWTTRTIELLKRDETIYECTEFVVTAEALDAFILCHKIDNIRIKLHREAAMVLIFRDSILNDTCYVSGMKSIDTNGIYFADDSIANFKDKDYWKRFIDNLINKSIKEYVNELYD